MWTTKLEADGFALTPCDLTEPETESLLQSLSDAPQVQSRAGMRHALTLPSVERLAHDERLMQLARDVLGPDALPFRATLFSKRPSSNWLVVWHQDTALPLRARSEILGWGPWSVKQGIVYAHAPAGALENVLALRIHLDECTAETGPLRVIPGSHRLGVLSDAAIEALVARTPAEDCLVARGGALAMRPLIVHSSSKSHAAAPRRILHIEYAACRAISDGLELAQA